MDLLRKSRGGAACRDGGIVFIAFPRVQPLSQLRSTSEYREAVFLEQRIALFRSPYTGEPTAAAEIGQI